MPSHQVVLLDALSSPIAAGIIKVLHSSSSFACGLERAFRFEGSKIRWDLVSGHISTTEGKRNAPLFSEFFDDRCRELGTNRTAIYLNDGPLDFALSASLLTFQRHLSDIISIPAHHYFTAEDFGWCIAYTMEGDIDFGRPARET